MNIEIIGGDPATQKAVQARLASRGFAGPWPGGDTLGSHVDSCQSGPLPARLWVFFPSGDILTDAGTHVASVRREGWSNREALGRLLAAAPELLAALGWLMERAEAEVARLPDDARADLLQLACENARAAIAKAERNEP